MIVLVKKDEVNKVSAEPFGCDQQLKVTGTTRMDPERKIKAKIMGELLGSGEEVMLPMDAIIGFELGDKNNTKVQFKEINRVRQSG